MDIMKLPIPHIVTLAPAGLADPGVAVAGSRAGAVGVLDFGFGFDGEAVLRAAEGVARYLRGQGHGRKHALGFGLRLPVEAAGAWALGRLPSELSVVVAVGGRGKALDWAGPGAVLGRGGRRLVGMAEVTSRDAARAAVAAGFPALIVAGHEAGGWGSDSSSFILLQAVLGAVGAPVWVRGGIGPHSAAACLAAGAAGVVLDGALLLARES